MEDFIEIDVREDLRNKLEPFDKIMGTVKRLKEEQDLIIHAPFNPLPLHKVLGRRGFCHQVEKMGRRHYKVIYSKKESRKRGSTR